MARADRQQMRTLEPPAKRGEIFDRNGRVLAYSVDADTIAADPDRKSTIRPTSRAQVCARARRLHARIGAGDCARTCAAATPFAYVARQVSPEEAQRVRGARAARASRFSRKAAATIRTASWPRTSLGYVGLDNVGLGGIESAYDSQIRGQRRQGPDPDRRASATRSSAASSGRPPPARGIELTIDQYLQYIAERELRVGVEENHAAGGTAIIMDPHTGEILALANWPTFNPNAFARADDDDRRNRAIQNLYEPGSTFKIVTASAALEQQRHHARDDGRDQPRLHHLPRPQADLRHAPLRPDPVHRRDRQVEQRRRDQGRAASSAPQRLGELHQPLRLRPDARRRTSAARPRASSGTRRSSNDSALASVSMGYQVGVTPLQMVTAASSVANGGAAAEPRVVRAFIKDGHRVEVRAQGGAPDDHCRTPRRR